MNRKSHVTRSTLARIFEVFIINKMNTFLKFMRGVVRRPFATRVEFSKSFMPRKGFGGKLKLSQFLKFTHPDKFSAAGS